MKDLLFLEPVFQERIWGGRGLEKTFGYEIPAGNIGECWGISAHPNGESTVKNGKYAGQKLSALWGKTPELFGTTTEEKFPLLVKVLDANSDLSVQVHPDDAYGAIHEDGELGKTECWYVIDCTDDAQLIFGHNAKTKTEAEEMIATGDWNGFLRHQPVKKGDFFYVPAGTIHALCTGIIVLEVQQSSDTTYRLYDYNRTDEAGNPRELHLEKSLDVSTIPHVDPNPERKLIVESDGLDVTQLVSNEFFSVYKYDVHGEASHEFAKPAYTLISVIDGHGKIGGTPVKMGDHLLAPVNMGELTFEGQFQLIVAQP